MGYIKANSIHKELHVAKECGNLYVNKIKTSTASLSVTSALGKATYVTALRYEQKEQTEKDVRANLRME